VSRVAGQFHQIAAPIPDPRINIAKAIHRRREPTLETT
jgi:hypothetical protein